MPPWLWQKGNNSASWWCRNAMQPRICSLLLKGEVKSDGRWFTRGISIIICRRDRAMKTGMWGWRYGKNVEMCCRDCYPKKFKWKISRGFSDFCFSVGTLLFTPAGGVMYLFPWSWRKCQSVLTDQTSHTHCSVLLVAYSQKSKMSPLFWIPWLAFHCVTSFHSHI